MHCDNWQNKCERLDDRVHNVKRSLAFLGKNMREARGIFTLVSCALVILVLLSQSGVSLWWGLLIEKSWEVLRRLPWVGYHELSYWAGLSCLWPWRRCQSGESSRMPTLPLSLMGKAIQLLLLSAWMEVWDLCKPTPLEATWEVQRKTWHRSSLGMKAGVHSDLKNLEQMK